MRLIKLIPLLLGLFPSLVIAQVSTGTSTVFEITAGSVKMIVLNWASSSAGLSRDTTSAYFSGKIIGVGTYPGLAAPSDNYDIQIYDIDNQNVDILAGAGFDRDTVNDEVIGEASVGAIRGSRLAFEITNAGSGKGGAVRNKVIIWIR